MIVVSTYMILLGVMVYDRMPPRHVVTALTADFFAGTFYTTIVGRLLLSANNLPADSRFGLALGIGSQPITCRPTAGLGWR